MTNTMLAGLDKLTFVEMVTRFPNEESAIAFLEAARWADGASCSRCGCTDVGRIATKRARPIWYCSGCRKQFSVTTGTVMEDTKIGLHKWLLAIHLMCASKKGVSALQVHRMLGIAPRSAWHLCHRIRSAMTNLDTPVLSGTVEADELYIGGCRRGQGRAFRKNKTPMLTVVERDGQAHSHVLAGREVSLPAVTRLLSEHVSPDAVLNTDESPLYRKLGETFAAHDTVNHGLYQYSRNDMVTGRRASTNTVEGYFGNFRRQIDGIHHHVSVRHLHRYSNEFEFKYNTRTMKDGQRTAQAVRRLENRRLTLYKIAKNVPSLRD